MKQDVRTISVVANDVLFPREDWSYPFDLEQLEAEAERLDSQMGALGVKVQFVHDPERRIEANGYGDILNAIRIRSNSPGLGNLCLGHVIGSSENLDLIEDVGRGVRRIAFAP
jgi:hypothetical protein